MRAILQLASQVVDSGVRSTGPAPCPRFVLSGRLHAHLPSSRSSAANPDAGSRLRGTYTCYSTSRSCPLVSLDTGGGVVSTLIKRQTILSATRTRTSPVPARFYQACQGTTCWVRSASPRTGPAACPSSRSPPRVGTSKRWPARRATTSPSPSTRAGCDVEGED